MGLMDDVKAKLGPARGKVSDLAQRHEGKIHHGLDKAAQAVDKTTKGKYSDRIQSGTGRAKDAMGRLTHHDDTRPDMGGTTTPGTDARTTPGTTRPPGTGRTAPPRDGGGTPHPEAPPPTS
ncbi:MT0933-like antitoxin protein [Streptomyces sp. Ag82_O1-12]|uniref:antitoxin n=1 Tax=unclassified Streptomyces TaxID=2593676 RepID=UPI000BCCAF6B|nr:MULTISPECIES: antitoxin [unclassified Streptomyces]SMQ19403.1 MT0933-like antitoxin protein [Streptomyces sp. Ag82_O1-12]SOD48444.1 MT0933-like antitoxin protein [Streptomyces sp. Ag82_G6-1]